MAHIVDLRKQKKVHMFQKIGLYVQNLSTMLGSIVNIIYLFGGGLYDHWMRKRIFTLIMNNIFVWAPKIVRGIAVGMIWTS